MNSQMPGSSAFSQPQPNMQPMISGFTAQQPGAFPNVPQQRSPGNRAPSQDDVIMDLSQPQALTTESVQYLNGFLRTQIGNRVKVEFLVGTNTYLEKSGKLLAVGANFIVLQESMTDDLLVCDFFNIKFVTIYR